MEHTVSTVQYPEMRQQVIAALESLADPEHQRTQWGVVEPGVSYYDDLTLNVHILYDDCVVLPDPTSRVGTMLFEDEVPALRDLDGVFGPLLDELGDAPDEVYLADPRWPAVVRAARRALDVMLKHEQ